MGGAGMDRKRKKLFVRPTLTEEGSLAELTTSFGGRLGLFLITF